MNPKYIPGPSEFTGMLNSLYSAKKTGKITDEEIVELIHAVEKMANIKFTFKLPPGVERVEV